MNNLSSQTECDDTSDDISDDVLDSILTCQLLQTRWVQETDLARREVYGQAYQAAVERLFELLEQDLERIARGWVRSGIAPDIHSLKYNLFTPIFQALPKLRVDPERNVRNLLLTIARRGIYDMYRQDMCGASSRSSSSSMVDSDSMQMWSQLPSTYGYFQLDYDVDRASLNAEDTWINVIDNQECLDAISQFWARALVEIDRQIVALRLRDLTFKEITRRLGSGWGESAVRQRYHRVILRTRQHLQAIGLICQI
jgi:DNA-directed RNA polymerase specialized sigma24 family protein